MVAYMSYSLLYISSLFTQSSASSSFTPMLIRSPASPAAVWLSRRATGPLPMPSDSIISFPLPVSRMAMLSPASRTPCLGLTAVPQNSVYRRSPSSGMLTIASLMQRSCLPANSSSSLSGLASNRLDTLSNTSAVSFTRLLRLSSRLSASCSCISNKSANCLSFLFGIITYSMAAIVASTPWVSSQSPKYAHTRHTPKKPQHTPIFLPLRNAEALSAPMTTAPAKATLPPPIAAPAPATAAHATAYMPTLPLSMRAVNAANMPPRLTPRIQYGAAAAQQAPAVRNSAVMSRSPMPLPKWARFKATAAL